MTVDPPSLGEITASQAVAQRLREPVAARPTPVWAALLFTFVANMSAAVVAVGVFFVAEAGFGFGARRNLYLGLVMGATYIAGALGVGPALRAAAARIERITARLVLAAILVVMGLAASSMFLAHPRALGASAGWVIWPAIAVYSAAMGGLWPIVESYVTGGRRGDQLRKVVGWFNIVWSVGVLLTSWAMAPALGSPGGALSLMLVTGVVHILTCALLALFSPYPAREVHESHPHPPVYERLLAVFRLLLPTSYLLMYTMTPLIPSLLSRMDIEPERKPLVYSAFLGARVVSFAFFGRWSGWHGRWRTPIWTTGVMLAGFVATLLAPNVWIACAGLALFGIGLGGIYTGALYYVMEVGAGEVEAGGTHEALIGGGYTLGPLIGLAGLLLAESVPTDAGVAVTPERATAVLAALAAVGVAAFAIRLGKRPPRSATPSPEAQ